MTEELGASKVIIGEEEPRVRSIQAAPTADTAAIGITERGPISKALLCTSFDEYDRQFGGFTQDSDVALAAAGFFENGGSRLWVSRTVHYADLSDPNTATALRASGELVTGGGPAPAVLVGAAPSFALTDGDRIVLSVNGAADMTVTFSGTAASVLAAGPGPYALSDGLLLSVRLDGGPEQTVVFQAVDFADISTATALEVAAVLNANLFSARAKVVGGAVELASDTLGSASRVQVIGGSANAVLGFPTGIVAGTGTVTDLVAVTLAEVEALVEAAIPDVQVVVGSGGALELRTVATGPTATLRAQAGTASAFGFDGDLHTGSAAGAVAAVVVEGKDPGAYANRIEIETRAASNGSASAFDFFVIDDGVYRERFPNLTMDPASSRYLERIVNDAKTGSVLVRVTDLGLAGSPVPTPQFAALAGGDDGLTGLDDGDFVGSEAGKTGLHAFDQVQDVALLTAPGRATPAVHQAMVRYCEVTRKGMMFPILDPPAGLSATEMVDYVTTVAALENLSEYGAIYWPRVKVLNPSRSVFGSAEQIVVPPSGIIAGVYARTDAARPGGVYDSPAGIELGRMFGVLGFETDEVLEEAKRDLVYPHRINPLTTETGLPRYIDGSRTLKADGNFPFIGERRGVIFIEKSVKRGLQFARHRNNTETLRSQVRRTITAFLIKQMNNGAFRSRVPAEAFFVDASDKLNTAAVVFSGRLLARVGLATNKPAEFVIVMFSQDTRAIEAELAEAGG